MPAVEWRHVDLAVFSRTPTTEEKCVLVCEAKRMRRGLQGVLRQPAGCAKKPGLDDCRKILLAPRLRFYLYQGDGKRWPTETQPDGYVNPERIRENHLISAGTDAIEALMARTPTGVDRKLSTAHGAAPPIPPS